MRSLDFGAAAVLLSVVTLLCLLGLTAWRRWLKRAQPEPMTPTGGGVASMGTVFAVELWEDSGKAASRIRSVEEGAAGSPAVGRHTLLPPTTPAGTHVLRPDSSTTPPPRKKTSMFGTDKIGTSAPMESYQMVNLDEEAHSHVVSNAPLLGESPPPRPDVSALTLALDRMLAQQPRTLFMDTYLLLQREPIAPTASGAALVQHARSFDSGYKQVTVNFYTSHATFDAALDLYANPVIATTIPPLVHACSQDGWAGQAPYRAPSGIPFPPHLVIERGTTMATWRKCNRPHMMSVLSMVAALADLLQRLHRSGHVHRGLTPDSVLLLLDSEEWRLTDFSIMAKEGSIVFPSCCLPYAPPEVLRALRERRTLAAAAAHDIWALGVMAYEGLANAALFPPLATHAHVFLHGEGRQAYPWESAATCSRAFRNTPLHVCTALQQCLNRDAAQRPSATQLVAMLAR